MWSGGRWKMEVDGTLNWVPVHLYKRCRWYIYICVLYIHRCITIIENSKNDSWSAVMIWDFGGGIKYQTCHMSNDDPTTNATFQIAFTIYIAFYMQRDRHQRICVIWLSHDDTQRQLLPQSSSSSSLWFTSSVGAAFPRRGSHILQYHHRSQPRQQKVNLFSNHQRSVLQQLLKWTKIIPMRVRTNRTTFIVRHFHDLRCGISRPPLALQLLLQLQLLLLLNQHQKQRDGTCSRTPKRC